MYLHVICYSPCICIQFHVMKIRKRGKKCTKLRTATHSTKKANERAQTVEQLIICSNKEIVCMCAHSSIFAYSNGFGHFAIAIVHTQSPLSWTHTNYLTKMRMNNKKKTNENTHRVKTFATMLFDRMKMKLADWPIITHSRKTNCISHRVRVPSFG